MADLFARIGILLVAIAHILPNEFSDTLLDGLSLALIVYASVLFAFVIAELFNIDLIRTGENQ